MKLFLLSQLLKAIEKSRKVKGVEIKELNFIQAQ